MALQPLPTLWNLYNLTGSPYFQGTLEAHARSTRPLNLFVGREQELAALQSTVLGAAEQGSRQAVAGLPGVGKTTLVQELKAVLLANDYFTTDDLIAIQPHDSTESVFGRVLGAVYDTILANRPHTADHPAMRDAQVLVRASRLAGGGGSFSAFGVGGGATKTQTVISPKDLMIDGPRVLRDLMRLVRGSDAHGVVLHVNNLETLSEADASRAAEIFRGLRDPMLMHDGLHYVVVGTVEAVNTVVNSFQQIRNIFSTLTVAPFDLRDVNRMLVERYKHLRLDESKPFIAPADHQAVAELYALFRGDLRGLLKALEDGTTPLLGIAGTTTSAGPSSPHVRPLTLDELRPALGDRYRRELDTYAEQTRIEQLRQWGESRPDSVQTQKTLGDLWSVSQGTVSSALKFLIQQGYAIALPRSGGEPIRYVLSGTSRLIFG
jgi:hypothetical protein